MHLKQSLIAGKAQWEERQTKDLKISDFDPGSKDDCLFFILCNI
jgi:hypothetical protein